MVVPHMRQMPHCLDCSPDGEMYTGTQMFSRGEYIDTISIQCVGMDVLGPHGGCCIVPGADPGIGDVYLIPCRVEHHHQL